MDGIEDFLGHESILSGQILGEGRNIALKRSDVYLRLLGEFGQNMPNLNQIFPLRGFTEGKRNFLIRNHIDIDLTFFKLLLKLFRITIDNSNRVEE
jgi:hypothetical protein